LHEELISKQKSAEVKEEALGIIQTMYEEHVVGYKNKK